MGRSTEVREQELKFEAPIDAALPDLRPLVGRTVRLPLQELDTAYFDSADGRLWKRGLTLRHRRTDGVETGEWTLKTPVDSDSLVVRTEMTWPGGRAAVPPSAEAILRGVLRREPIRKLVRLDTVRQRLILRDDQDSAVAELDDDLVSVAGGPRDGMRFRQVELELREGGSWCSRPVVARLEAAGLTAEPTAKFARAMDLAGSVAELRDSKRPQSLVAVLEARVLDGFERLVDHDWRLRLALPEVQAEDVHQARVATRRLRSDLKTFGGFVDPLWVRHVRRDLKWLGEALGEVRDADVLGSTLSGMPAELERVLADQRAAAGQRIAIVLDSQRYLRLLDRLHAASTRAPIAGGQAARRADDDARAHLPGLVQARWRALNHQVRKARRHPSPKRLHRVRIKAKDVRYASESAALVLGAPARRLAKAAARLQTDLGEHHDVVVAERWLRDVATKECRPAPPTSSSFEAGALAAELRLRQDDHERSWWRSWKSLAKPNRRRWLS